MGLEASIGISADHVRHTIFIKIPHGQRKGYGAAWLKSLPGLYRTDVSGLQINSVEEIDQWVAAPGCTHADSVA